jgi:hypothetical protein
MEENMENMEDLKLENSEKEAAVENAAEREAPPAKTYTQEEVDQIVGKKKAMERARIQKQTDRDYGELLGVLRAGTGKNTVNEITDTFRNYYEKNNVPVPKPTAEAHSDKDLEVLAKADAEEIIQGGYDEVVDEMDRLMKIGTDKMTAREKAVFRALAANRSGADRAKELDKIGASKEVYNSREYKDFAKQFRDDVPAAKVYETYQKTRTKSYETHGSMKNTASSDTLVKDFYTPDEARRFTQKDIASNPDLYKALVNSRKKWGK